MTNATFYRMGDQISVHSVTRAWVTAVICLGFNAQGESGSTMEDAVAGRDETQVDLDGAYGFYFVDREVLLVVVKEGDEPHECPLPDTEEHVINFGPTFYDPQRCRIGSAAAFLAEHPSHKQLTKYVGTEEGERMVLVTTPTKSGSPYYYYTACALEDRLLGEQRETAVEA